MITLNYRRNVFLKLAWRQAACLPRTWRRWRVSDDGYRRSPPALANSVPKSGTHLLLQILAAVPGLHDWGNFWASQPSFPFRERPGTAMAHRIHRVAPSELVCGHLYHSAAAEAALRARSVVHVFIYRDPRDVAVSEAHYLAHMNRWHRMHRRFRRLPSDADRILLSIQGAPDAPVEYPDIGARFERFTGWLGRPDVCAVPYEDLMSERRRATVRRILQFYLVQANRDLDLDALVEKACAAIRPERSHTFRRGGSGGWRRSFDTRLKDAFKAATGDLVVRLGYERTPEW